MDRSISERATDPKQYDEGEILWSEEGHGLSPIRRMFLEKLAPHLGAIAGFRTLDVGCGQGWLTQEMTERGAEAVGIDPSARNIQAARNQHPDVTFEQSDLQTFKDVKGFDLITAVMVFEHLRSAPDGFAQLATLLRDRGQLLLVAGDFEKFTHPRHGYTVETEELAPGEVATRTDYGERAGVIYDINRTTEMLERSADDYFTLEEHQPIAAPEWLVQEQPRYALHNGTPLFQLLKFAVKVAP